MITVTAPVWLWSGGQARWHFLTVPEDQANEIRAHSFGDNRRGFGSVRVSATINPSSRSGQTVTWRTSVFPQRSGGYILPIKADVRRSAGIEAGDDVTVTLQLL